jgi:hypothetical protein
MQRSGQAPEEHARRHPCHHAILPAQGGAEGLQRNKESKEEGHGRVEVALLEADVRGKVGRLGIPYLSRLIVSGEVLHPGRAQLTLALSRALKRKRSARKGSSRQSSFRSVRLCRRGSTEYAPSASSFSSGGMVRREGCEGVGVSSHDCTPPSACCQGRITRPLAPDDLSLEVWGCSRRDVQTCA